VTPVYQKRAADCVIAAVATLASVDYDAVKAVAGSARDGLDRTETRKLLTTFGLRHAYSVPRKRYTALEWAATHRRDRALLIVRPTESTKPVPGDHAIVAHRGQLHDPQTYPDLEALVVEVYRIKGSTT
jgi:hypothetical protein